MTDRCPKGQIERIGYSFTKKQSKKLIKVKPTCIDDKGKPGKGPKLITIPREDQGLLDKYGYTLKKSHIDRVKALKKAYREINHLKILRYLNAIRTLQKSNEKYYNKLDKDVKWLQEYYKRT
jgi:hypothetical protein